MGQKAEKILYGIANARDKVLEILKFKPEARDNDKALVCRYWVDELIELGYNPDTISATTFIKLYFDGKIREADEITRARRIVQSKHKDARGKSWNERHGVSKDVAEQIANAV